MVIQRRVRTIPTTNLTQGTPLRPSQHSPTALSPDGSATVRWRPPCYSRALQAYLLTSRLRRARRPLATERSAKHTTRHRTPDTGTLRKAITRARKQLGASRFAELGTLTVFLLLAMMCFGFAHLADAVGEGETGAFDNAVMLAMRSADDPTNPI